MNTNFMARAACLSILAVCGVFFAGCPCKNAVQIHNDTILPVTEVHVKYVVESNYGDNLISGSIIPSQTQNIANLVPGRYNVEVVFFGGGTSVQEVDVLCDNTYTLEASHTS